MDSWPNQEALNKALNVYRASMRPFIISRLKQIQGTNVESTVTDSLGYRRAAEIRHILIQPNRSIESAIDVNDFPHLVSKNWVDAFEIPLNDDKTFRNQLWLIMECRNADWAHPSEGDAEYEGTRVHLFHIADVLGKINEPDAKRRIESIRDKLDDTAERLSEAETRLKAVEAESADYKASLSEVEKHLEAAEAEKIEYEEHNAKLSEQVEKSTTKLDEKQECLNKLSEQFSESESEKNKYKEQLEAEKVAHAACKDDLKSTSERLEDAVGEWISSEERRAATGKLLTIATVGNRKVQAVFPPLGTDTPVRILDRRGTDKRSYLLELLEQKQPTIIYVQDEEMINLLLTRVLPKKADVIGRHNAQTSEAQEIEILEKLENGELVAVVSNTTFSTLRPSHCVEHFVYCHLAPDLDAFFKRCQSAFTSTKNAYLHLIYESKENVEELGEKYPDDKALRKLYQKFRDRIPIEGEFISAENLYSELCQESELDMTRLGIETGFSIFEELGFLEQNEKGIRHLSTTPTDLDESSTYCRGEKLKKEAEKSPAFQYEQSVKQIWEEILKELNLESEQIVRGSIPDKIPSEIPEVEDDTQPTTGTDQNKVTPPTPIVWPQRGIKTFSALREHATNNSAADELISAKNEWQSPIIKGSVKRSPLSEDIEDYQNKYNLAMQFVREHGISALEEGIAQLIADQNNPDYDFTEDETNMLRAFQYALTDFQAQSEQSAAAIESESIVIKEVAEAKPTSKPTRANAKVTEEQVKEIRSRSAAGESNSKLAKEFGLTPPAVRSIVLRNTWKHVE